MGDPVQSVVRAFAVLRTLAAHPAPVGLATIAEQTSLPKSTVSRLLTTLESLAVVERGEQPGTYALGPGLGALAGGPTSTATIVAIADPYLGELAERCGEDAGVAVPDGRHVRFVHQVSSPNPVQVQDWTGTRFPPHALASGHVMMASWSEEALGAYLAGRLAAHTERTVTDPDELRARVRAARDVGYAWTYEEWSPDINAVAAAVHGRGGTLLGAINVYGPAYRFPGDADEAALGRRVARTARVVSRHLAGG